MNRSMDEKSSKKSNFEGSCSDLLDHLDEEIKAVDLVPKPQGCESYWKNLFGLRKFTKAQPQQVDQLLGAQSAAQNKDIHRGNINAQSGLQYPVGTESSTILSGMAFRERTFPNVLNRIKYIIDNKGETPQQYKDADFKQFWLPDGESKACYDCSDKFNPFRRRHHCRICGQIFCSNCCSKMVPGKIMGYKGELRVCVFCCKVAISFLKSTNVEEDVLADLKAIEEQLLPLEIDSNSEIDSCHHSSSHTDGKPNSNRKRKTKYGFMEENYTVHSRILDDREVEQISSERELLLKDSQQLQSLWSQMVSGPNPLPLSTNRWKLKVFPHSFIGKDFVQWLINNDKASSRQSAVAIGQALLEAGFIVCISQSSQFFVDDYVIYNILKPECVESKSAGSTVQSAAQDIGQEPLWLKQITSQVEGGASGKTTIGSPYRIQRGSSTSESLADASMSSSNYSLDMNIEENVVSVKNPRKRSEKRMETSESVDGFQSSVTKVLNLSVTNSQTEQPSSSAMLMDEVLEAIKTLEAREVEMRPSGWKQPDQISESAEIEKPVDEQTKLSLTVQERFNRLWSSHENALLYQLLDTSGISSSWAEVMMPIVYKVIETVRPDVKNEFDDMDIRQYIQFKKVPGGKRKECQIINGTVCTKNVVHRDMKVRYSDPQILLISSDIDHTAGAESQVLSVSRVLTQETDYLKKVIPKIISYRPNIILCRKRISYNAREELRAAGITLVMNLKQSVMERVARCTQAQIINSVDRELSSVPVNLNSVSTPLGMCHSFYLRPYILTSSPTPKTLMYFDGCATHLGCTIILRGASNAELKQVKRIMYFMIFALYNWKLERSLLLDDFAFYPAYPGDNFLSDDNDTCNSSMEKGEAGAGSSSKDQESIEFRRKLGELDEQCGLSGDDLGNREITQVTVRETPKETPKAGELRKEMLDTAADIKELSLAESILKADDKGLTLVDSDGKVFPSNDDPYLLSEATITDGIVDEESDIPQTIKPRTSTLLTIETEESLDQEAKDVSDDKSTSTDSKLVYPSHSTPEKSRQMETVDDYSDPLQSYIRKGSLRLLNIPDNKTAAEVGVKQSYFKKALDGTILSVSPYLTYDLPYLESSAGWHSSLRQYFPEKLFVSHIFNKRKCKKKFPSKDVQVIKENKKNEIQPPHFFVTSKITKNARNIAVRADLADFRARGCTIRNICQCEHKEGEEADLEKVTPQSQDNDDDDDELLNEERKQHYSSFILTSDGHLDALHPYNHQHISVLFSSFSHLYHQSSTFCVDPWVLTMDFYGRNDISLGAYLERYCFNLAYKCPLEECNTKCLHHVRKFVHGKGCVEILLRKMESTLDDTFSSAIYMWNWCKICRQVSPVVPMSSDTWHFSFAKYLELRFHETTISRRGNPGCPHSIHQDHFHYFGHKNLVSVIRYSTLEIRELIIPPVEIYYVLNPTHRSAIVDQIKYIAVQGYSIFSMILERLTTVSEEIGQRWEPLISSISSHHQQQRKVFREGIESIQLQLTSPSLERRCLDASSPTSCQELATIMYGIQDQVTIIKRLIVKVVYDWNSKVQSLYQLRKRDERTEKTKNPTAGAEQPTLTTARQASFPVLSTAPTTQDTLNMGASPTLPRLATNQVSTDEAGTDSTLTEGLTQTCVEEKRKKMIRSSSNPEPTHEIPLSLQNVIDDGYNVSDPDLSSHQSLQFMAQNLLEERKHIFHLVDALSTVETPTVTSPPPPKSPSGTSVSNVKTEMEGSEAVLGTCAADESIKISDAIDPLSVPLRQGLQHISPVKTYQHHERSLSDEADICYTKETIEKIPEKRYSSSVKNIISTLLSSSADLMLKSPFDPSEHYIVLSEVKIPLIIYDDEPSSIISVGLASQEYDAQLQLLQSKLSDFTISCENLQRGPGSFDVQGGSSDNSEITFAQDISQGTANTMSELLSLKDQHIELQWSDSHAKYYCKVLFAEQFRRLRQLVFPYGEEFFIRSLSRCVIWDARGGKSGSFFCKTTDDRFILKEMGRLEISSFLEFAPDYIQYMMDRHKNNHPTMLTRIVGVFRVGFRNTTTNKAQKLDLLVMENLFYQRTIGPKYDLKGSVRNRKVDVTGKEESEVVLLDENLLQMACSSQFFLRPHSKTVLSRAIASDSAFLSQHFIMDYSLLVGVDEKKNEIVVGIIDYIRTFTWDKKLETILKGSVLGAGTGKQPTVISPELYRKRFCLAMEKYFAMSPDRWSGLGISFDS